MTLLNLSLVTNVLTELLTAHIRASPAWPFVPYGAPIVTGQPPDLLDPGTLGVYLYHVAEDSFLKNEPADGAGPVPVRLVPMALSLYYQVCALGSGVGEQITVQEQILIGCAAKALHDYPMIDDTTTVPRVIPQPPLQLLSSAGLDGAGNHLRIALQPVTYHEASSFWNSASLVPRLALYYQVSVVLLEPDRPTSVAGRVFQYGLQSFVGGAPRLDGSQNTLAVQVPGLPAQSLVARPAEVPVGGQVIFTGYNLVGDATRLKLQHFQWPDPVEADAGWGVVATDDRVFATVQPEADGHPIMPGQYSARIRVIRNRQLPDGSTRAYPVMSNGTPFSISARIDTLTFVLDVATVTGYAFGAPDPSVPAFPPDAVQVSVGDTMLVERTAAGALDPGQFRVIDPLTLEFRLPADLPAGRPASLRLFVLGAESPPRWFTP